MSGMVIWEHDNAAHCALRIFIRIFIRIFMCDRIYKRQPLQSKNCKGNLGQILFETNGTGYITRFTRKNM